MKYCPTTMSKRPSTRHTSSSVIICKHPRLRLKLYCGHVILVQLWFTFIRKWWIFLELFLEPSSPMYMSICMSIYSYISCHQNSEWIPNSLRRNHVFYGYNCCMIANANDYRWFCFYTTGIIYFIIVHIHAPSHIYAHSYKSLLLWETTVSIISCFMISKQTQRDIIGKCKKNNQTHTQISLY